MGDLISRKALAKALIDEREQFPPNTERRYSFGAKLPNRFNQAMRGGIRKALRLVETAPTIDAVEVVRCKDCKFEKIESKCPVKFAGLWVPKDWYCAFGESKSWEDKK